MQSANLGKLFISEFEISAIWQAHILEIKQIKTSATA